MTWPKLTRGEWVRADVTSPPAVLSFPLLELIAITGAMWMMIGYIDNPTSVNVDPLVRNALVGLWAGLVVWRFVLPLVRARRRRVVVTNRRLIVRAASLRPCVESIPVSDILNVQWRRGRLSVAVVGHDRLLYFRNVAKLRHVAAALEESVAVSREFDRGYYSSPRR